MTPPSAAPSGLPLRMSCQAAMPMGARAADTVWFNIDGRLGAKLKEAVCTGVVKHLADEAGKPGAYRLHRVSGGATRQRLLQAKQAGQAEAPVAVAAL
ncbi:hypothetical protein ACFY7H_05160 [Streptomyces sp. NPDC012794]|uniref:hypothetical protein n=1 Tax=Streptomyces sp. NPDC012794 TaxID=3364850 RepID=UPI00368D86C6